MIIDKQWDGDSKDVLDAGKVRLYIGDSEQVILYYTKKLAPGAYTDTSFLNKISFDADMDNSYTDKAINVNITVCAVQATADSEISQSAMFAEWGMYPEFDENGVITDIKE